MSKVNVPIALLSVVTSVLLWASVYNNTNRKPEKKDFFAQLQPSNLDQRKFVIVSIPTEVKVTLTGSSDQLKTASPYAIVDLSMASQTVTNYPVIIFPSSVRELILNSGIIAQVKIQALATKAFDVKGVHTGIAPDGREVESVDVFPPKVYVTGPEEVVAKVSKVQVSVDYSAAAVSPEGVTIEAKALDAAGIEVQRLILRTTAGHPEYTEETLKEPAVIRANLKLAAPATKPLVKLP